MRNVIVTGATSFIGVHLIQKLIDANCFVYALVRPGSSNFNRLLKSNQIKVIELELADIKGILQYIELADAFYHLAWEGARVPYRDNHELQERNLACAVEAIKTAIALNVKIFVGAGSQAEYGKFNGKVDESYPCNPITEYGKAKYKAYQELSQIANKSNMRFIWMRIFSVYGKFDYSGTLVMSCLDKMRRNLPMKMTECVQKWDFIYVGDVADAMLKFLKIECPSGVYNIASGRAMPLKKYVEELRDILKSDSVIEYGAIPYGKEGPVSFEPVVSKVEKALGWTASTSFEEGIREILFNENNGDDKLL